MQKDVDDAVAADRAWFIWHPKATERRRPPSRGEIITAAWLAGQDIPDGFELEGEVLVVQAAPGVRFRYYSSVRIIAPRMTA